MTFNFCFYQITDFSTGNLHTRYSDSGEKSRTNFRVFVHLFMFELQVHTGQKQLNGQTGKNSIAALL